MRPGAVREGTRRSEKTKYEIENMKCKRVNFN